MSNSLAPEALEPLLRGSFGRPYVYVESCESTQGLLPADAPEGAVAATDEQTAGRGRLGRTWAAPTGAAILCSTLLRPPPGRRIAELSIVGGIAVADTVELALGLAAQIKWPNDVMVNRYKVAGVLAEARNGAVVLGIGINVNQIRDELPADARVHAGSLRTVDGVVRERAALLADLLAHLERAYADWLRGGLDALFDALAPRDFLRGRRVTVDGVRTLAHGIDREGRLVIDVDGWRRPIESGEVSYEQ
jgi:BirA family transcriptional regulator, biotin operon repressor / biotin---[acetyl-CoA-carboxylase] ligase